MCMLRYLGNLFSRNVSKQRFNKLDNDEPESQMNAIAPIGSTKKFIPNEDNKPKKVRLITDNYHLEGLGQLNNGTFFLVKSQQIIDHITMQVTDYICKFSFDNNGDLIDQAIVKVGVRGQLAHEDGVKIYTSLHPVKGTYKAADFFVKPFSVECDGVEFGLIVRTPDDEEDLWCVEFMPGNNMAFFEPWDSGDYDT